MSPAGQRQDSPSHSAIMSTISASSATRLIISGYRRASAAPTGPIADQLHQVAEYVAAGRVLEPEHPVGAIQRVEQAAYPRGGDRLGPPPAGTNPRPSSGSPAATHCRVAALSALARHHRAPTRGARSPVTPAATTTPLVPPSHPTSSSPSADTAPARSTDCR